VFVIVLLLLLQHVVVLWLLRFGCCVVDCKLVQLFNVLLLYSLRTK